MATVEAIGVSWCVERVRDGEVGETRDAKTTTNLQRLEDRRVRDCRGGIED